MSGLATLIAPRSIVLVGAAHTESKLGGIILKNLLSFKGKVYPVNPKYAEMMGVKTYPSVPELPLDADAPCDVAIVIRPAGEVPGILRELQHKARNAVIVSSGFAEVGETALQEEVRRIGKETGIRLLGPNCMGIFNPHRSLDTFFVSRQKLKRPRKGNVAILSQSGAVMTCLFDAVREANTGVSTAIGFGNAVDIDTPELYDYFIDDSTTDIVISYIESLGEGRAFLDAARRLMERKSLVVLKSGKGTSGQAAAYSHTGRLAGRYEVFTSLLQQFGIPEAADFDGLVDAAKALSYQKPSKGSRICIVTNGGGAGVLAADECMRQGLEAPRVSEEALQRLKRRFPAFYGMNNPIDLTAQVRDEEYAAALDEVRDEYDGFLLIALAGVAGITPQLAALAKDFRARAGKPLVAYTANEAARPLKALLEKAGIPVYPSPERAVRGLKALLR